MAELIPTCEAANLSEVGGTVTCTQWVYHEYTPPFIYELPMEDITLLMGASLLFFVTCAIGNAFYRKIMNADTSESG